MSRVYEYRVEGSQGTAGSIVSTKPIGKWALVQTKLASIFVDGRKIDVTDEGIFVFSWINKTYRFKTLDAAITELKRLQDGGEENA